MTDDKIILLWLKLDLVDDKTIWLTIKFDLTDDKTLLLWLKLALTDDKTIWHDWLLNYFKLTESETEFYLQIPSLTKVWLIWQKNEWKNDWNLI